jgi:hypothetical protein
MHGRADHTAANLQTGQLAQLAETFPRIDQLENGQCRWPVVCSAPSRSHIAGQIAAPARRIAALKAMAQANLSDRTIAT